uniref:Uncharacterized protein n=1 Tax=Anguilla anguilla TaxID=7936 RepID=A0A0E9VVC8_ANGAN
MSTISRVLHSGPAEPQCLQVTTVTQHITDQ